MKLNRQKCCMVSREKGAFLSLCSYLDQLLELEYPLRSVFNFFQIMTGKCQTIALPPPGKLDERSPTPGCDSHMSREGTDPSKKFGENFSRNLVRYSQNNKTIISHFDFFNWML